MKQKLFTIGVIAVIAITGLFVFDHVTSAHTSGSETHQAEIKSAVDAVARE